MLWLFLPACVTTPPDSASEAEPCAEPATWYADVDGDGYGDAGNPYVRCGAPRGFVATGDDCDDNDPAVHPGLRFAADLDGDGFGDPDNPVYACETATGVVVDTRDCDDTRADVHPGAQERCDGAADEDCDGLVDGADPSVDVTLEPLWYPDADGDGHGVAAGPIHACGQPAGYAPVGDDCDDDAASAYPGAAEECGNGTDDNCNGEFDGCGLSGTFDVEAAVFAVSGGWSSSLGWAVLGLDDLDADGLPELAVASPSEADGGVVRVFRSGSSGWVSTGDAGAELTAEDSTGSFGYRLATGDVDGDGLRDLVVADPEFAGEIGAHAGRVAVFLAPFAPREDVEFADARRTGEVDGRFSALLGVGDWDGDGRSDLVLGGLATGDGLVRIDTAPLDTPDATSADPVTATIGGTWTSRVAAGGDLDGDGLSEVAVATGTAVRVVSGGWTGEADADDMALSAVTVEGTVAVLGVSDDLDGDGRADLLVGAGASVAWFPAPLAATLGATDARSTWTDEVTTEGFGASFAVVGDEDADGDGDLLLGAYAADEGADLDVGAALLFHAPFPAGVTLASAADARILGHEDSALAGWALAPLGDRDGDGRADLLVGAPGSSEAYVIAGGGF